MKGVTSGADVQRNRRIFVSIHTPNEGSDYVGQSKNIHNRLFQSTLPMKGVTPPAAIMLLFQLVSIHTPNEGSDVSG